MRNKGIKPHLLWLPFSLESWVINLRWLPFSVHLIIPILRLGGIRIRDVLWLFPVIGLGVIGVIDGGTVIPVLWLLGLGILDLLGWKEAPVILKVSRLSLLSINEDLVGLVRLNNEGVDVGVHVVLATDVPIKSNQIRVILMDS